ncbi:MAG: hypothetical protein HAW61_02580 [Candidatus Portiera sp.]|nr:hypothetical protein [Portiera sp.]
MRLVKYFLLRAMALLGTGVFAYMLSTFFYCGLSDGCSDGVTRLIIMAVAGLAIFGVLFGYE